MKKLALIITTMICLNSEAQIDLSCDVSIAGIYPTVKMTYPLYDQFIVGGSYGYNVFHYLISDRIDLTLGYKFNEWVQIEADFGMITGFATQRDKEEGNKMAIPHLDFGIKGHFFNNCFYTLQVAYPGFIKFGLGVRLRPYKQLTIWDKQF